MEREAKRRKVARITILSLPFDIMGWIFSFLSIEEVSSVERSCHYLQKAVSSKWRFLFLEKMRLEGILMPSFLTYLRELEERDDAEYWKGVWKRVHKYRDDESLYKKRSKCPFCCISFLQSFIILNNLEDPATTFVSITKRCTDCKFQR